jgi:hypothetical protein
MMKKIAIALGVLALLVGVMAYNVWRAGTETIAYKPGVVEQGRMDLHTQLVQAEQREAEIEKVYWNAPEKLAVLIHSHEQRIEKLAGNPAGSEIVAHDKDAIARLQKRIEAIAAERAAAAEAQAASAQAAQDAAGTSPSNP